MTAGRTGRLRELQRLWVEDAIRYNIFPLNDNLAQRLQDAYAHFAPPGDLFTYWTPGAVRINEPLSAAQLVRPALTLCELCAITTPPYWVVSVR